MLILNFQIQKNLFNKDLNFEINKGDLVKIMGQSGPVKQP